MEPVRSLEGQPPPDWKTQGHFQGLRWCSGTKKHVTCFEEQPCQDWGAHPRCQVERCVSTRGAGIHVGPQLGRRRKAGERQAKHPEGNSGPAADSSCRGVGP